MAVVRSTEAHAAITSIDKSEAEAYPGVIAVYTAEDLEFGGGIPMVWDPPGVEIKAPDHMPLKSGEVKCVGDPVAVVIGSDKYGVVDAAEMVIVDYEPKEAVVDPEAALEDGSPLVWDDFGTNKSHEWAVAGGDIDAALEEADVVLEHRIANHRIAGAPIEPRGAMVEPRGDTLTLTSSTQIPHITRFILSGVVGISEDHLRVIAPDVGGGFGAKLNTCVEEAILCAVARKLGRPVKWIETRSENMAYTHHGRDQVAHITMGAKSDGTVTGVKARIVSDLGAYFQILTPFIAELGFPVAGGCYKFSAIDLHFTGVFTNKFATDAIRGAGRPEMTHWVEIMMDRLAREVDLDPVEIRRKNFIPAEEFPYETPLGIVYDSGNYEGTLDMMLENLDLDAFRTEQEELREQGVHRGVGFSTYTEVCGLAPSRAVGPQGVGLQAAFWESATVRVHPSGSATVYSGASPHGQGLDTSYAQIAADRLGIDMAQVEVLHGDTNQGPFGWGTYGSRSLSVGGEAIARACRAGAGEGEEGLCRHARGCRGGHRARRRRLPGQGPARQVDVDGRHRGRSPHPARGAAGRHRAGARGIGVLRPGELRVPVRRARVHRRGGCRDRQGQDRAMGRRRRLRARDQPHADRRPGPWRHHPRHRPGAL